MSTFTKLLLAMAKGRQIQVKLKDGRIEAGRFMDGNRDAIRIHQVATADVLNDLPFGDTGDTLECIIQMRDIQSVIL